MGGQLISYRYAPLLVLATVFTCFNVFLGSVYIAQKKTKHTFYTSLAAGVINIILNFALIPRFGIYGAAIATFAAYFAVFFYRLYDSRRYIHFDFSLSKILTNTVLLACMVILNQLDVNPWLFYGSLGLVFVLVVMVNIRELLYIAAAMVPAKIRSKIGIFKKLEKIVKI